MNHECNYLISRFTRCLVHTLASGVMQKDILMRTLLRIAPPYIHTSEYATPQEIRPPIPVKLCTKWPHLIFAWAEMLTEHFEWLMQQVTWQTDFAFDYIAAAKLLLTTSYVIFAHFFFILSWTSKITVQIVHCTLQSILLNSR